MTKRVKARRGRGEGTILERADGTWYAQISNGIDGNGKRKRITVVGKTKSEVRDKLAKKLTLRAEGTLISPDQVTVGGFLTRWLAAIKGSVKASTHESYARYIAVHINPALGNVKLQKLDMLHVETMLAEMTRTTREKSTEDLKRKRNKARTPQPEQPSSNRTKKYARAILSKALDHAVIGNLIPRNVARLAPTPKGSSVKEMTILDEAGVNRLLKQIAAEPRERYGRVYALSVLTGMREGEYLALQWQDIDLKAIPPVLRVRRTQSTAGKQVTIESPKTRSATRTITLTQSAVEILEEQRRQMLKEGRLNQPFVFVDEQGKMLVRSGPVRSCLRRVAAAAELPWLTPHDLRHTHATLLLRAGVNPKVVSERLGHSGVRITLDIYSHVLPDTQADVIPRLNRLLG